MLSYLRNERFVLVLLAVLFFLTRLYNLTLLPIFTDEAIYIYWAKYITTTHSHWFLALTDGKPPVLTWIIGILLSIFPASWYLIAGRLPSVVFGFGTLLGVFWLARLLFGSKTIAALSGIFVIFSPFLLVYDRLALYDAQLTAMLIWSVYFCVKTAKSLRIRDALLWGFFLGLAFLSKPPAILYLLITPLCFLLLLPKNVVKTGWKKIVGMIVLVGAVSEGMNNLQRISGAFQAAIIKNQQFQQPMDELLHHPFALLPGNLYVFTTWLLSYYTPLLFLGVVLSFCIAILKTKREGLTLFLLWIGPITAFAIAGREIFPRYLVFISPYAFIALAYALNLLWAKQKVSKMLVILCVIALLALPVRFCLALLIDPREAPMPTADFNQLVAEHPSGYGLEKVFAYIRSQSRSGLATVVPQGTFGLYPYAFYLEFWGDPAVRILPKWPLDKIDQEMYQAREKGEVVVILKEEKVIPPQLTDLQLIEKIYKPKSIKYPIFLTKMK